MSKMAEEKKMAARQEEAEGQPPAKKQKRLPADPEGELSSEGPPQRPALARSGSEGGEGAPDWLGGVPEATDGDSALLSRILKDFAVKAQVKRIDIGGGSWVEVRKAFLPVLPKKAPILMGKGKPASPGSADLFDKVWDGRPAQFPTLWMYGKNQPLPRWMQTYVQGGYNSRWRKARRFTGPTDDPTPMVSHLMGIMGALYPGYTFNMGLANFYTDGAHYIGAHSDSSDDLVAGAPICSLTWGGARRFVISPMSRNEREKEAKPILAARAKRDGGKPGGYVFGGVDISELSEKELETVDISLADGDLLVMGGNCQLTHKHGVPKCKAADKRINFTFRCLDPTLTHTWSPAAQQSS